MTIIPLTPMQTHYHWHLIEPLVQMAIEDEHYTSGDVKGFLDKGISRAYVVTDDGVPIACVTAELVNYPRAKVVRIHTAGGVNSKLWANSVVDRIAQDGAENGATEIQIIGRKGWLKVLDGFKAESVTMSKKI